MELVIVGNPVFTLGFRLAGVRRIIDAEDDASLNRAVRDLVDEEDVGVLVMEIADVQRLEPALRRQVEEGVDPTLVAIGIDEDTNLREKLKQAVGVDLWK